MVRKEIVRASPAAHSISSLAGLTTQPRPLESVRPPLARVKVDAARFSWLIRRRPCLVCSTASPLNELPAMTSPRVHLVLGVLAADTPPSVAASVSSSCHFMMGNSTGSFGDTPTTMTRDAYSRRGGRAKGRSFVGIARAWKRGVHAFGALQPRGTGSIDKGSSTCGAVLRRKRGRLLGPNIDSQ